MSSNKTKYRELSKISKLPAFHEPWWLDIVCEDKAWDVTLHLKDSRLIGSMPFMLENKWGSQISLMPPLTPYLGPYIPSLSSMSYLKKNSSELKVQQTLIDQLPSLDYIAHKWMPTELSWFPFFSNEFSETIRYTYLIGKKTQEEIYRDFYPDVKNKINKASDEITIIEDNSNTDSIVKIYKSFCKVKGIKMGLDDDSLKRLINTSISKDQGTILLAMHKNKIVGFQFLVNDLSSTYNLLLWAEPELKNQGIIQKLLNHSILASVKEGRSYDFEGSMIPSIAKVFQHFGGKRTPYHKVYRDKNKYLRFFRQVSGYGT